MDTDGQTQSVGSAMRGDGAEEVVHSFGALHVRVLRARGLETAIDAAALLGVGDVAEPPYWMHLWPGATALARRVAEDGQVGPDCRFLELGCGLALPSLVAALRGARGVATDWKVDPLRFARASAALNRQTLEVVQMSWEQPALREGFDLCLGADIAYDRAAEAPLIRALGRVLRPGGVAWLADSVNTYRDTLTGGLEAAGFACRVESCREEDDGRPVWVRVIEARRVGA